MDFVRLADEMTAWLREQLSAAHADGWVVGLSGGIDSAVVAALCQRATPGGVLAVWLPCHSLAEDEQFARMAAQSIGLDLQTVDLGPVYDAFLAVLPPGVDMARANLKPRLRMSALYFLAQTHNDLVAGTGNKPETTVGFFTKHGDGGVDIKPLGELLKCEVRGLAGVLGIPEAIIVRPPTPGLWPGQTDEGEMGITYAELDAILLAWERGESPDLPPDRVAHVERMMGRTAHKRLPSPVFPVRRL